MVDAETDPRAEPATLFPQSVGERLHVARTMAGLDLNDIATRTRVPIRHLEAIERSDYASLPSITYALGFARSFARAVGLDDVAVSRDLRSELGKAPLGAHDSQPYEPVDPSRVPSRLLAWTAAGLAVVLLAAYFIWKSMAFGDAVAPTVLAETPPPVASPAPPAPALPAPSATGQVVLTATTPVWVRIYDRADKVLLQKELAAGEGWPVPGNADKPMIRTGRPDAIKVTIDGREVAPLGPPERTIRDVELSAASLAARPVAAIGSPAGTKTTDTTAPGNTTAPPQ